ncbi:MAG: hypothetical protein JNJ54_17135 [Myxococcaceae bacterium]|nr:hypothetical protein [Myxococcaceae bacterium]
MCCAFAAGAAWGQLGPVNVTVGGRQVTLTWTSMAQGRTEVAWGNAPAPSFAAYPDRLVASNVATTTHSATLRRLSPGIWYVRARTGAFESSEQIVPIPANDGWPLADWAFDGPVNAVEHLGSSWYVGGSFRSVGPTTGGAFPSSFDGGAASHFPEVAGQVFAVEPDGSGGLYLGGAFSSVGGLRRTNVAHLLPDLGVDPGFAPNCNGAVYAIHRTLGSVYLAGAFTQVNGQNRTAVAELSPNGVVRGWAPTIVGPVFALESLGPVVYLGGTFFLVNGESRECVAAIGTDGGLQPWNPNLTGGCWVTGLTTEGSRLYVNGSFDTAAGQTQRGVAAFDVAGNLLPWRPTIAGPGAFVRAVLPNSADSVFIAGTFDTVSGAPRRGLALVDTDAGQVLPWNAPVDGGSILGLARDATRLFVVGYPPGRADSFFLANGAPAPWPISLNGLVRSVTTLPTSLYLAGDFTGTRDTARAALASVNAATGTLEPWSPSVTGGSFGTRVSALTPFGNALVVAGNFGQINGLPRGNVAIVTASGNVNLTWDPSVDGEVDAVAIAQGMVLIGGVFTQVNGLPRAYGAMLDLANGQPLGVDPLFNSSVTSIAVEGPTSYWVGNFGTSRGVTRGHAAAFDLQTFGLTPWNPAIGEGVEAVQIAGDRVALGGQFQFVNTWRGVNEQPTLALFDRDAGVLTAPNLRIASRAQALLSTGNTLYAAGFRLTDAGLLIAADLSTGSVRGFDVFGQQDPLLNTGVAEVIDLGLDCADRKLGVAGRFFSVGITPAGGLAAIDIPCDAGVLDAGADAGVPPDAGPDAGGPDGGTPDAGGPDAGQMTDSGFPDIDAGTPDAGADAGNGMDGGEIDAGLTIDGGADAGQPDAGQPDGGSDGGRSDAGALDAGGSGDAGLRAPILFIPASCGCAALDGFGPTLLGLFVLLWAGRRRV